MDAQVWGGPRDVVQEGKTPSQTSLSYGIAYVIDVNLLNLNIDYFMSKQLMQIVTFQ